MIIPILWISYTTRHMPDRLYRISDAVKLNPPKPIVVVSFSIMLLVIGCVDEFQNRNGQSDVPSNMEWSGTPGDPGFSVADRMAIKSVMDAYSIYWDSGDVDNFFNLFTDDAVRIMSSVENEDVSVPFQNQKDAAIKRLNYIRSQELQRRHLMMNTHFLQQTDSTAYLKQYTLLTSTENGKVLKTVSTIVYDFWLRKVDGVWKIEKYRSIEDNALDVKL